MGQGHEACGRSVHPALPSGTLFQLGYGTHHWHSNSSSVCLRRHCLRDCRHTRLSDSSLNCLFIIIIMKRSTSVSRGQRSRSDDAKDRFGALASFFLFLLIFGIFAFFHLKQPVGRCYIVSSPQFCMYIDEPTGCAQNNIITCIVLDLTSNLCFFHWFKAFSGDALFRQIAVILSLA